MRVLFFVVASVGVTQAFECDHLAFECDNFISLLQTNVVHVRGNRSNAASPMKTRFDGKCMDYDFGGSGGNVYMHDCHDGSNQQWFMEHETLKTNYNDKCLDMSSDGNVYMHDCHDGSNQQWYFEGESLKTRASHDKCLDYDYGGSGNIYMFNCHEGTNQDFYYSHPPNAAMASRVKSRHGDECLDYNFNDNNLYFHTCHDGTNQKFYLDGTLLKSLYDDKCADYNYNTKEVYMHTCHEEKNQQWYFDDEHLKTNYDDNCLNLDVSSGNVHMNSCHDGDEQQFYLENVVNGLEHDEVEDEIVQEIQDEQTCKNWCYSEKHASKRWDGFKCAWKSCVGCTECSST